MICSKIELCNSSCVLTIIIVIYESTNYNPQPKPILFEFKFGGKE